MRGHGTQFILAADMGGTSTRVGLFASAPQAALSLVTHCVLKTQDIKGLEQMFQAFVYCDPRLQPSRQSIFVLAVPGPVRGGEPIPPANVPWSVDPAELARLAAPAQTAIINDFTAQAWACLDPSAWGPVLRIGRPMADGHLAVMGAGTGLGHCLLVRRKNQAFQTVPSEAGHAAFPFINALEKKIESFVLKKTGLPYATNETVVSGPGLALVHEFFHGRALAPEKAAQFMNGRTKAGQCFARFYARAARNYALTVLPLHGLFISGGVALKNPWIVRSKAFFKEFNNSPKYGQVLADIPLRLLSGSTAGLRGAATFGREHLKNVFPENL
jgi:glucokinase